MMQQNPSLSILMDWKDFGKFEEYVKETLSSKNILKKAMREMSIIRNSVIKSENDRPCMDDFEEEEKIEEFYSNEPILFGKKKEMIINIPKYMPSIV